VDYKEFKNNMQATTTKIIILIRMTPKQPGKTLLAPKTLYFQARKAPIKK